MYLVENNQFSKHWIIPETLFQFSDLLDVALLPRAGGTKYLQTFLFPEHSLHIEFMDDQAVRKEPAHGTTSQFKTNIQL